MIYIPSKALSRATVSADALKKDKTNVNRYENCALGKSILYIGGHFLNNLYYIPVNSVERVYKRLAVSKGFFEPGKVFITIPYLVVQYDKGKTKTCRFTREENLDALLADIAKTTKIPIGKPKDKA